MPEAQMKKFPCDNNGKLKPTGEWRRNFNLAAWANECRQVEKELKAQRNEEEVMAHLEKIMWWTTAWWVLGCLMAPFNIVIGAIGISTSIMARWTMIGHHVMHGGYSEKQGRYHRFNFARGLRNRVMDWLDWMLPEAWNVEHNKLHHYKLGEVEDPDLVERNMEMIREQRRNGLPAVLVYGQIVAMSAIWKWFYYAPNTLKEFEKSEIETRGIKKNPVWAHLGTNPATVLEIIEGIIFKGRFNMAIDLLKITLPFAIMMFVTIPGFWYMVLGYDAAYNALITMIVGEILTNLHSFAIITPNHAGDDVYKFDTSVVAKSDEFLLRAVIGSVNFHTGSDFGEAGSFSSDMVDYFHGWLNYQIEHHMFPDMSMMQYQKAAPRIRAICKKHGVPYVQQPVWNRVIKLVKIMGGDANMLHWDSGE